MARDTFIFYRDWLNALNDMPDNVQLEAYKAIAQYALDGNAPELSPMTKIAFIFIKAQIDKDAERYPRGCLHWNWNGGVTSENKRQRSSSRYKQWRNSVFERDGYTCRSCGRHEGKLNAHHVKPFSIYPDLRFDVNNGVTLCEQCHIELHKQEREWLRR